MSYSGWACEIIRKPYFSETYKNLYQARQDCRDENPAKAEILKLLMNSSNGKHAQRLEQTQLVQHAGAGTLRSAVLDLWELPAPDAENHNKNPYMTALTTVLGRYTLWRKGIDIINSGGTLLYCDTDSWFYLGDGIESGKGINDWAAEDDDNSRHIFLGRKMWASDNVFKMKGMRQYDSDGKPLTYADFKTVLTSGKLSKKMTQFEKFRSASRKMRESVAVKDIIKEVKLDESLGVGFVKKQYAPNDHI